MPASLVAGLAVVLLRSAGRDYSCPIADALAAWHTSWQQNPRSSVAATAPLPGSVQGLGHHLQLFRNARDALTLHNLRLVYQIAGRNRERGIPLLDLIQEGTLGLMRAAEKYDYSLGFRFSTYSYNWISQAVGRLISDQRALIRYPNHIQEQLSQLYRCREELQLSSGVAPTEPQLARLSGLPLERVRSLLALRNQPSSLDSPVYDDNTETQGDQLAGGPFSEPTATANAESLRRCMRHALTSLTSAEEQVISLRWGLDDTAPLSRGDIAELMSVSREWVRQLEGTALEKLRGSELVREAFQDYRHTP